jgi:hypothetical protein
VSFFPWWLYSRRDLFAKVAGSEAAEAFFGASAPRSKLEQLQQNAARAYRNYAVLARGEGDTLLEILEESTYGQGVVRSGWTQAERYAAANLWARYAADAYAAARKLAGIDT